MSTEQQPVLSGTLPAEQPPTTPYTVILATWLGDPLEQPEAYIALPDAPEDEPWFGVNDANHWDLSGEHVSWRVVAAPTTEKEPTDGTPHQ